jgi:hypothetical protein
MAQHKSFTVDTEAKVYLCVCKDRGSPVRTKHRRPVTAVLLRLSHRPNDTIGTADLIGSLRFANPTHRKVDSGFTCSCRPMDRGRSGISACGFKDRAQPKLCR